MGIDCVVGVARLRGLYHGQLTYAANFDQYRFVTFWDRLDLLGINAYFPLIGRLLPEQPDADRAAILEARWRSLLRSLDAFRAEQGIPGQRVLFTEIGYVGRANSTVQPWSANGFSILPSATGPRLIVWADQPADPIERALAFAALYDAHLELGGELLAGLLYWKLSTVPAHREIEPFVLILGEDPPADPLLQALADFGSRLAFDRWKLRLAARVRALAERLVKIGPKAEPLPSGSEPAPPDRAIECVALPWQSPCRVLRRGPLSTPLRAAHGR